MDLSPGGRQTRSKVSFNNNNEVAHKIDRLDCDQQALAKVAEREPTRATLSGSIKGQMRDGTKFNTWEGMGLCLV